MSRLYVVLLIVCISLELNAQVLNKHEQKQIQQSAELDQLVQEKINQDQGALWGKTTQTPLLIVDRESHFTLSQDSIYVENCIHAGTFYVAYLPRNLTIAYSSINLSGKTYATITYPFWEDSAAAMTSTVLHEMFHAFQKINHWKEASYNNQHMQYSDARVYLQMEIKALNYALQSLSDSLEIYLSEALFFRNQRQLLYPDFMDDENDFEIQEGLAFYTELNLYYASKQEVIEKLIQSNEQLLLAASYVRSFGYQTGASYAQLLDRGSYIWKPNYKGDVPLVYIIRKAYPIKPYDEVEALGLLQKYEYQNLFRKEDSINQLKEKQQCAIFDKWNRATRLIIPSTLMKNIAFNVNEIYPIGDTLTYYRVFEIAGDWGKIRAGNGCIFYKGDYNIILENEKVQKHKVVADNIELLLHKEWEIVPVKNSNPKRFTIKSKK